MCVCVCACAGTQLELIVSTGVARNMRLSDSRIRRLAREAVAIVRPPPPHPLHTPSAPPPHPWDFQLDKNL
eukprot:376855-Prorocentrum_minimum.AAC.2